MEKLIILLILLVLFFSVESRYITTSTYSISDGFNGISNLSESSSFIKQFSAEAEEGGTCEKSYGVLPCSTTMLENIFLICVYGHMIFRGAGYISTGSEHLIKINGPGIINGLFIPILGAVPDAMLILVSGLSGNKEKVESQISVGMGLLAGSTVMFLTLVWGSCVFLGKCDLVESFAKDGQDTRGLSLTGSGVSTDIWTKYAACLMTTSIIPFIIVQLPLVFHITTGRRFGILVSLVVAVGILLSICCYQVLQPNLQKRRLAFVKHKHVMSGILGHLKKQSLGRLLTDEGEPNKEVLTKLYQMMDLNHDEKLSSSELRALIIGIQFEEGSFDTDDAVLKLILDFDTSGDTLLNEEEFVAGISKWLNEAKRATTPARDPGQRSIKIIDHFKQDIAKEQNLVGDEVIEVIEDYKWITIKAVVLLLLGTVLTVAFADPLVDTIQNFSTSTHIPSFFVSFMILPLATNSKEAVSALIFASQKKRRATSLTFSEIYRMLALDNIIRLIVFLSLVYFKHLTWDFSAEVITILIVCAVMGGFTSLRTTFPLWIGLVAFILYPFSLALVYLLNYVLGWA